MAQWSGEWLEFAKDLHLRGRSAAYIAAEVTSKSGRHCETSTVAGWRERGFLNHARPLLQPQWPARAKKMAGELRAEGFSWRRCAAILAAEFNRECSHTLIRYWLRKDI